MINIISSDVLIWIINDLRSHQDLHIAISHRSYLRNDGGIEHCLRREGELAKLAKTDFLHVCPVDAINDDRRSCSVIEISLNNIFIGLTSLDGFSAKLCVLKPSISFLHSSLGFESGSLIRLLLSLRKYGPILQWVHDLAFACESVTLVRNGLACGVPSLGADSCYQCKFESSRASVIEHYDQIERLSNVQLFPSLAAKSRYNFIFSFKGRQCLLKQFVIPHYIVDCVPSVTIRPQLFQDDESVGVAFFGHSVSHKGWSEYIHLVNVLHERSCYRFYHVGSAVQSDARVQCLSFSETLGEVESDTLRDFCSYHNIRVAFFWPVALESFGLFFRQVIGAGLAILCTDNNEALKEFINDCPQIRYFRQVDHLIAWLDHFENVKQLSRHAAHSTCVLEMSKCSYELLSNQTGHWKLPSTSTVEPSRFLYF